MLFHFRTQVQWVPVEQILLFLMKPYLNVSLYMLSK